MITILKLDHRPIRDKRITTHCALVSRAFNASSFVYSGIEDSGFEKNIEMISKQWGGFFKVKFTDKPKDFFKKFNGKKIHLTMYGEKITNDIENIKKDYLKEDLLIIVGGPKVEGFYYENSDYNISVTNQPHSEVAALSIILYFLNPSCLDEDNFKNNIIKITPSKDKKNVLSLK